MGRRVEYVGNYNVFCECRGQMLSYGILNRGTLTFATHPIHRVIAGVEKKPLSEVGSSFEQSGNKDRKKERESTRSLLPRVTRYVIGCSFIPLHRCPVTGSDKFARSLCWSEWICVYCFYDLRPYILSRCWRRVTIITMLNYSGRILGSGYDNQGL